jgi:hypothetical protein
MTHPLPNFFCIGAQKAGTTSLFHLLRQHPDVFIPPQKEAHFFDHEERFRKGIEWYLDYFYREYENEKICGSITPSYAFHKKCPERMSRMLGKDLKLIFILRDPVNRAWSHYQMQKMKGIESLSFENAIKVEKERIGLNESNYLDFSYISRGYYAKQIERYLKFFKLQNILFLDFEKQISQDLKQTVREVETFLGISAYQYSFDIHENASTDFPNLPVPLRRFYHF